MARQFDIVENPNPRTRRDFPFLIVLQSDRAASLSTIVAAPLIPAASVFERSRMHPEIQVNGSRYVLLAERLAAIARTSLGQPVASGAERRYEITAAIDMLFTGV